MSKKRSKAAKEELKPHGDALSAIVDFDRHGNDPTGVDPVPMPEDGGHAHSAAAHLSTAAQPHVKPEGNLRQGSHPGALRQPPMVQSRIGKLNRGQ